MTLLLARVARPADGQRTESLFAELLGRVSRAYHVSSPILVCHADTEEDRVVSFEQARQRKAPPGVMNWSVARELYGLLVAIEGPDGPRTPSKP